MSKEALEIIKKTGLSVDDTNLYYLITMLPPSRVRNEILDYIIENEF